MFKNLGKKKEEEKGYLYVNPDKRSVNWREVKKGKWGSQKIKIRLGGGRHFVKTFQLLDRTKDSVIKTENEHVELRFEAATQNLFLYCSSDYTEEDIYNNKPQRFYEMVIEKILLFFSTKTIRNLGNIDVIQKGLELMAKAKYFGLWFQVDGFNSAINVVDHGEIKGIFSFEIISRYLNTHNSDWTECVSVKNLGAVLE